MKWTRKYEALRLILAVLVCAAIPVVSMAESDDNPVEKFPPPCADSLQCDDNQVIAETFALYYWRDRIDLDETYLDNGWQMARIRDYLARSPRIDSITIFAYASPEGAYRRNVWLSEQRAEAAKEYLLAHRPDSSALDPEDILLRPMHENWAGKSGVSSSSTAVIPINILSGGTCRACVWLRGSASGGLPNRT